MTIDLNLPLSALLAVYLTYDYARSRLFVRITLLEWAVMAASWYFFFLYLFKEFSL